MTRPSPRRLLRGRASVPAVALGAMLIAAPGMASAQAIERNLPPAPKPSAPRIAPANLAPADQDATPIGPALSGVVTLGRDDAAVARPGPGVDVSRTPRLRTDIGGLRRFIGRPLSRTLIAQVEAEIASSYRRAGHPFVSLSTPEQEITSGVLQVRVMEFRLADKTAPGAGPSDAAYIESRVRAAPGQPIASNLLAEDLDWLNRFAFRKTQAVFTPATTPGGTDLLLQTTTSKPWSAYFGYANSGSALTGMDRYFAGFQTTVPGLRDSLFSYQYTGSPDAVLYQNEPFNSAPDAQYASHAGRLVIPTAPRQDIEASVSYVRSNQPIQAFVSQQTTLELSLAYRSALSNFSILPGEGLVGVESKRDDSRTSFADVEIHSAGVDVFQLLLGYAWQGNDRLGRTALELNLHASPGGIDPRNSQTAFSAFAPGASLSPTYSYLSGDLSRYTALPPLFGLHGLALSNSLIGQYSKLPLPQTEQMGEGGQSLVRGYTLDDGAFDSGVVSRNELRLPTYVALNGLNQASPYLFLDVGYGVSNQTGKSADPASAGVGLDDQLSAHFTASLDSAWALRRTGYTGASAGKLEARVTVSF